MIKIFFLKYQILNIENKFIVLRSPLISTNIFAWKNGRQKLKLLWFSPKNKGRFVFNFKDIVIKYFDFYLFDANKYDYFHEKVRFKKLAKNKVNKLKAFSLIECYDSAWVFQYLIIISKTKLQMPVALKKRLLKILCPNIHHKKLIIFNNLSRNKFALNFEYKTKLNINYPLYVTKKDEYHITPTCRRKDMTIKKKKDVEEALFFNSSNIVQGKLTCTFSDTLSQLIPNSYVLSFKHSCKLFSNSFSHSKILNKQMKKDKRQSKKNPNDCCALGEMRCYIFKKFFFKKIPLEILLKKFKKQSKAVINTIESQINYFYNFCNLTVQHFFILL
ncbi:hypothetical protein RFI_25168 [Reticulomyxa filosa]|uniref:Uncharacterized protein n=1 Tax=Reticulomyxa filosa TaxID=46433 RepID=X6MDW3_RETFI|nr:hypothetical protein RFI_25168 [Reticulomyxa filosa]|eukprot:ETO12208.1 hypothetical protein RFI_25168 [Reticulomyxa filosa]